MPEPNKQQRKKNLPALENEQDQVELLAKEIYDKTMSQLNASELYGIDPITIIIVIGIIINVIRVIQECNKEKTNSLPKGERDMLLSTDIKFRAFNSGWFTKLRLKKIIKKHLTKEQYNKYVEALVKSLLESGKTVKEEQVSALLEYK